MPDELTDEAKAEIKEAIAIVRADKFEAHARGILSGFVPKTGDPKDPPTGDPPPPTKDEPKPARKPLWVVGTPDEPAEPSKADAG